MFLYLTREGKNGNPMSIDFLWESQWVLLYNSKISLTLNNENSRNPRKNYDMSLIIIIIININNKLLLGPGKYAFIFCEICIIICTYFINDSSYFAIRNTSKTRKKHNK